MQSIIAITVVGARMAVNAKNTHMILKEIWFPLRGSLRILAQVAAARNQFARLAMECKRTAVIILQRVAAGRTTISDLCWL